MQKEDASHFCAFVFCLSSRVYLSCEAWAGKLGPGSLGREAWAVKLDRAGEGSHAKRGCPQLTRG